MRGARIKKVTLPIPEEVLLVAQSLKDARFEAFLVGGCVRDLVLGREPKDWDIATNAKPEEIQHLFPESIYENSFGTVAVKTGSEDPNLKLVEVTTFRIEGKYTDKRHPDEVHFAKTIEEDLSRRDFTINAMAITMTDDKRPMTNNSRQSSAAGYEVVDPFHGQEDLKKGIIRTVGNPDERFHEDALRLMRAVRFAVQLDFQIAPETRKAIVLHAQSLRAIAGERIRDELIKILMTPRAADGILLLEDTGLLEYVLPELREGIHVGQNKHHIYTVFEHNVKALDYTAKKDYSLLVRAASLLHDVGKPRVKGGDGPDSTFYNHDLVGGKMAFTMLHRLHFPKEFVERAAHLVRSHLFYYNVGEVSEAGVRRFLRRVGPENVEDLFKVREADRIGSGVPKAVPYKTRHLLFMIDKVKHDPISPKMLQVNGEDVMQLLEIPGGPKVGFILAILLEEVLDDPSKNDRTLLEKQIQKLGGLEEKELARMASKAKEKKEEFEVDAEEEIKKKYHVQ